MLESGPINFRGDTVGCLIIDSLKGFNNVNL
jgi:hypothetical protein